jgi:hypothetical protein
MEIIITLIQIISILGALASIFSLYLTPGPVPFGASIVAVGAIVAIGARAQSKLANVLDESLSERLRSIQEIRKVTINIPRVTADELLKKLKDDVSFLNSLEGRLARIFGLRRELTPIIEPELVSLIDDELEPLFNLEVGTCSLKRDKLKQFALVAVKLDERVRTIEIKLGKEYRKRFGFS